MSLYFAIDAGGTKTDYALADDDRILARSRSGTIKRTRTDAGTATRSFQQGIAALASASGCDLRAVSFTCIGTAGETVPLVTEFLREVHRERVGGGLLVLGDVEIALEAAFPHAGGVLAIAGTGSNVAARNAGGPVHTAGGYGPLLADQGSGYQIGLQAMRAALIAHDEGRAPMLLNALLATCNLTTFQELIAFGNTVPAPDFSRLTPAVVACAESGDEVAQEVLRKQGVELGYLVRLLLRRLRQERGTAEAAVPLAFTGGVAASVRLMREALLEAVREEFPDTPEIPGVVDPVEGALLRARQRG